MEILTIIVAAWNLNMSNANAICAKTDLKYDKGLLELASFIIGEEIKPSEFFQTSTEYANQCIEHYNNFKSLSKDIKYTKWKSLSKNGLIKTYGVMFDMYMNSGYDTSFINYLPFLKLSDRQFAKVFIKLKQII